MESTAKTHAGIALILAMSMALGPLAIDTYLPAFPAMAESLAVDIHSISLSIAAYVIALAFGQLVAGPLSDRLGRQIIMLTGLSIFAVSSLMISYAQSLDSLLLWRAFQAFGGGWAAVCVPAIVRDRLSGNEAARFFSLIGLIMITAPAIAPSIGSLILLQWSWSAIFVFLAIYGLVTIGMLKLVLFRGPQLPPKINKTQSIVQSYISVIKNRPALRFMFLQTLAFSIMLLFITHSSFIYQTHFGASPSEFSLLFGANILLMFSINLINRLLLKHFQSRRILRWSVSLQALGITLLLLVMTFTPSLWLFLPAIMLTIGAQGAIIPNTQACYMDYFSQNSGTAAALLGATQFLGAGLISAASTLLPESVIMIIILQACCSLICLGLVWAGKNYFTV